MIGLLRSELRRIRGRRLVWVLGAVALLVILLSELRIFAVTSRDGVGHPQLIGEQSLHDGAIAVGAASAILGFIIGASYVGADWNAGTMQALLFWEPRRLRVLLAKAVALVVAMTAFLLTLEVVTYTLTYVVAATHGSTEGVTGGYHVSVLLLVLRAIFAVGVVSLVGFAIAGLARVTAAALATMFVYFVVLEPIVLRLLRPAWERYYLGPNVAAVFTKHADVAAAHTHSGTFDRAYTLSGMRGAVTLLVYVALLLGAYAASFVRRDVT